MPAEGKNDDDVKGQIGQLVQKVNSLNIKEEDGKGESCSYKT